MKDVQSIPLDKIDTGARMCGSYDRPVAALAASIRDGAEAGIGHDGLRHPIEVRARGENYVLISGLHRLRAFEALERSEIAAFVLEVDDIQAARLELEENLVRADLNVLDRALFVKRLREMFEAEHGAVSAGRPDNRGNVPLFSETVIERLGMSGDMCKRALRIANGLHSDAVRALRDHDWTMNHAVDWTDNQKGLLDLVGVPLEQQADVVALLANAPAFSMRDAIAKEAGAKPPAPDDEDEKWFRKSTAILTAEKRLRRRFFAEALNKDFDLLRETAEEHGFTLTLTAGRKS